MKGSLSLDFIVAMIVVMTLASVVITFAYFQQEKIVEAGFRVGAELLAINVGSTLNRIVAITDPNDEIEATITPHDITTTHGFFGVIVDSTECHYNISSGYLFVTITYHMSGTGRSGKVIAEYPVIISALFNANLGDRSCDTSFIVKHQSGGWSLA